MGNLLGIFQNFIKDRSIKNCSSDTLRIQEGLRACVRACVRLNFKLRWGFFF